MSSTHAKSILDQGRMSGWQWVVVLVTVGLNALDGFDVLSISFTSTAIARDWGIDKAALGWVLSMELIGMAVGSLCLGGVADRIGRRPAILGCLVAMSIGMFGAAHSNGVNMLLAFRLLTGLGIGGMLAAINAAAYECTNNRWRNLAMALMVIGYPLGGVIFGPFAQHLLKIGSWHDVFLFGAALTAAFIPLVLLFVPESVAFLERLRPNNALRRINTVLNRFGHAPIAELPAVVEQRGKVSLAELFSPKLIAVTLLVTLAYFAHMIVFYFLLKWSPKIAADMLHLDPPTSAGIVTWVSRGGAIGGALFGLIAIRVGVKPLTIVALVASALAVVWFGRGAGDLPALTAMVTLAGFFTNAGIVGLYTLFARVFPTHVRATGTGFAIGVGRGGAALAPVLAGYLFKAGFTLQTVATLMAVGSLLGAVALLLLKHREESPAARA